MRQGRASHTNRLLFAEGGRASLRGVLDLVELRSLIDGLREQSMEKVMTIKVAINGYGTIGKRAGAVDAQDDMEIIGVTKTRPSFGCDLAVRKGYPLYCTYNDPEKIAAFGPAGYTCHGGLDDLLAIADVVVDCSPGKVGAANKEAYVKAGVKYIFQGGEKHAMAEMSYTSSANHAENMNVAGTRVVSCNTTGLSRTLVPLYEHCGSLKVECTMIEEPLTPVIRRKAPSTPSNPC